MLKQLCRRARQALLLRHRPSFATSSFLAPLYDILFSKVKNSAHRLEDGMSDNLFNNINSVRLPEDSYQAILHYLQARGEPFRHRFNVEHMDQPLLPSMGKKLNTFTRHGQDFASHTRHVGNSVITWIAQDKLHYGVIKCMWQQALSGKLRTFFEIHPFKTLSAQDATRNPFAAAPGFLAKLAYNDLETAVVLEEDALCSHASCRVRPAGAFGIKQRTVVMVSLDRGRHFSLLNARCA